MLCDSCDEQILEDDMVVTFYQWGAPMRWSEHYWHQACLDYEVESEQIVLRKGEDDEWEEV